MVAADPVESEPSGVAPDEARGHPFAARSIPDDFGGGEALAEGVEDIEEDVGEVEGAAEEEVAGEVGEAEVGARAGGGVDGDLEAGDGLFAGAEDGEVVEVFFFHFLGEFEVEEGIAEFGLAQDGAEFFGGEADGGMHQGVDIADAGEGGSGLLVAEAGGVNCAAVGIIEGHGNSNG